MEIKEAILDCEREKIKDFLSKHGLKYREDTEYSAYAVSEGEIVATVSYTGNIIMGLAVREDMQGENLSATLVTHVISRLRDRGIYGYRVFTKPENRAVFESLGFRELISDCDFVAFEGGTWDINSAVTSLKTKATMDLGGISEDVCAIVINGNPFTRGHLALCEYALARHKQLLLFVLSEDLSYFSYKERFSLAYIATRQFGNRVSVLPSTEYIVSRATFPDYFLHGSDLATRSYAKYDAMIFEKYFMSGIGIAKRYLGSETIDYMRIYNEEVLSVLGERAEVVQRFREDGRELSAKEVRRLIEEGKREEALSLVPISCRAVFSLILNGKS